MSVEKTIILVWLLSNISNLFTGKKPPDDIMLIDKLRDMNDLKSNIFNVINIIKVNNE
tara:strand:+ start:401 stop:574 length:174 start_codon:yes stop_codon:yes gene_type:complete